MRRTTGIVFAALFLGILIVAATVAGSKKAQTTNCQVTYVRFENEFEKHDVNKVLILKDAQQERDADGDFVLHPKIRVFNGCTAPISGSIDYQIVRKKQREQLYSGSFYVKTLPPNTSTSVVSYHIYGKPDLLDAGEEFNQDYELLGPHLEQ